MLQTPTLRRPFQLSERSARGEALPSAEPATATVLLVDDDEDLVELMTFALRRSSFQVLTATGRARALRLVRREAPDLVVLDVNLGLADGFEVLRELRRWTDVPVIMLTGRDAQRDKVLGLDLGADDYVTKPFNYPELIARIRAAIRRHRGALAAPQTAEGSARSTLCVGPLTLNLAEHSLVKNGQPIKLTPTEYRLLQLLMERSGSVVTLRTIIKEVWGFDDPNGSNLVRVTMFRLRQKLESTPSQPELLHTIAGAGMMAKATRADL